MAPVTRKEPGGQGPGNTDVEEVSREGLREKDPLLPLRGKKAT